MINPQEIEDVIHFIQSKAQYEKIYNQKIEILRTKNRNDETQKYLSLCINLSKMDNEDLAKINATSIIKHKEEIYAILKTIGLQRIIDVAKYFDSEVNDFFTNVKEKLPEEFI